MRSYVEKVRDSYLQGSIRELGLGTPALVRFAPLLLEGGRLGVLALRLF